MEPQEATGKQQEKVMNTTRSTTRAAVVLAAGILGLSVLDVSATPPSFNVTFSDGTPGLQPPVSPPNVGGVSTNATFTYAASPNSLLVQNTYTDPITLNVFGDGNVAVLQHDDTNSADIVQMIFEDNLDASAENIHLSWDMMVRSGSTGFGGYYLYDTNVVPIAGAVFGWAGYAYLDQVDTNGANIGLPFLGNFAQGTSEHFDLYLNYATGQQSLYRNGSLMGATDFDYKAPFGQSAFELFGSDGATVAIDNISIIPEPSTIGLLGLGLSAIFARRRPVGRPGEAA